ncbi:GntR family transcriptional regulator [Micrococcales bacterium 31B]|nr:GntR family transcriptional regulator [Micrococcales bacterium 31B]
MTLPKLAPSARMGDQVFDALHAAIVTGELAAGDRLRIRDLATSLGTSVMPVREAITRLQEVGLAEAVPYKGAFVKGFTHRELLELYSVRRILEVEATLRGVEGSEKSTVAALREAFAVMEEALRAQDAAAYIEADEAFLSILYSAAENQVLLDTIRSLWHRCRSYKVMGARSEIERGNIKPLLTCQRDLLAAVKNGDVGGASEVTEKSLDAATARIREAMDAASGPSAP